METLDPSINSLLYSIKTKYNTILITRFIQKLINRKNSEIEVSWNNGPNSKA